MGHMYGYDHGWMFGQGGWFMLGWIWMALLWLIPLLVLLALIKYLLSRPGHNGGPAGKVQSRALDILDEAYAKGEIDRDEYLKRRADLENKS